MPDESFHLDIDGYCPICEHDAKFVARDIWLRGALICQSCAGGSVPRERALAHVLNRVQPNWRDLRIHECSPCERGVSTKMRTECPLYTGTHYFSDQPLGVNVGKWRNENIEKQTFEAASFDIVVTQDVAEHVFNPGAMYREIYRTLAAGGVYISTFPIRNHQTDATKQLARLLPDGSVKILKDPPEYHGNPIDGAGSLVTWDYGYDIHKVINYWAPFRVEISRFHDAHLGIMGEYTEVVICQKPAN